MKKKIANKILSTRKVMINKNYDKKKDIKTESDTTFLVIQNQVKSFHCILTLGKYFQTLFLIS